MNYNQILSQNFFVEKILMHMEGLKKLFMANFKHFNHKNYKNDISRDNYAIDS